MEEGRVAPQTAMSAMSEAYARRRVMAASASSPKLSAVSCAPTGEADASAAANRTILCLNMLDSNPPTRMSNIIPFHKRCTKRRGLDREYEKCGVKPHA